MRSRSRGLAAAFVLAIAAAACAGGTETGTTGTGGSSGTGGHAAGGTGGGSASSSSSSASSSAGSSNGSGGAGGSGGTGGSSGTGGSGTGGSSGIACHWKFNTNPCGAGMYCAADGCGDGVCVPVGTTEDGTRAPICGSDGVTYWNATVAAKHGMAMQTSGACSPAKTCGGITATPCPSGATCNYELPSKTLCSASDASGTCWAIPATCAPMVGLGPQTRACGAATCTDECALVKQGTPWYADVSCPQ